MMTGSPRRRADGRRAVAVEGERVLAELPLPVAGLMSTAPMATCAPALAACWRRRATGLVLAAARSVHGDGVHGAGGHPQPEADRRRAGGRGSLEVVDLFVD